MGLQSYEDTTNQGQSGHVRGKGRPDQREDQRGRTGRVAPERSENWAVPERVSGEAGPWASLALFAIGGILGQLIKDLEYQLAYQQSSIEWYEAEIQKNQDALEWHTEKLEEVHQRLEETMAHAEAIRRSMDG